MKERNIVEVRYSLEEAATKSALPYEVSVAVLFTKSMEEKERERVGVDVREERSRYIPPPLFALHEEKEE